MWKEVVTDKPLTYKEAKDWIEKLDSFSYISRHNYDDIHFYDNGVYSILKESGVIVTNPTNIPFKDEDDWIIVIPSSRARNILKKKGVFLTRKKRVSKMKE